MAVTLVGDRHEAQLLAEVQRLVDQEAGRRQQQQAWGAAGTGAGTVGNVVVGPYVGVSYKKVRTP